MYYLVKLNRDWADEFSVFGYKIMEPEEFRSFFDYLDVNKDAEISLSFGTNEGWDHETIGEYARCLTSVAISDATAHELIRNNMRSFGHFWDLEELKEAASYEEEEY
jgi:hypothetical protein